MAEQGLSDRYSGVTLAALQKDERFIEPVKNLTRENPMIRYIPVHGANGMLSHTGSRQTSLPTATVTKLGGYWPRTVAQWEKFTDDIAMFHDSIAVPRDTLMKVADPLRKARAIKAAHWDALGQSCENALLSSDSSADPEKFDGLEVRYKTPDNATGATYHELNPDPSTAADYGVYDAGGTGTGASADTTSIWILQLGEEKVTLRVPMHDPALGFEYLDLGDQNVEADPDDSTQHRLEWQAELSWSFGPSIADLRAVARIRNIETAISGVSNSTIRLLYQAINEAFHGPEPKMMFVPPRIMTHFLILAESKQNIQWSADNPWNIRLPMFGDVPIRQSRAITITEAAVAAV